MSGKCNNPGIQNGFYFDISAVLFEEEYRNSEYHTVTLYFNAPVSWLNGRYPDAIGTTISAEYPFGVEPNAKDITLMMSPTRETEDGFEDYDWADLELAYSDIDELLNLATTSKKKSNKNGLQFK